jgi:hypothetical protein
VFVTYAGSYFCDRLEDWIRALELNNYVLTNDPDRENGYEKVAIYVTADHSPQHVARQLDSGVWISKMGRLEDITHATLSALEGEEYGAAEIFMKRVRH